LGPDVLQLLDVRRVDVLQRRVTRQLVVATGSRPQIFVFGVLLDLGVREHGPAHAEQDSYDAARYKGEPLSHCVSFPVPGDFRARTLHNSVTETTALRFP